MKQNLKGAPLPELERMMVEIGHSAFRGRQLFQWIYRKRETDFGKMTSLSKMFRKDLGEKCYIPSLRAEQEQKSADGTVKYLIALEDGEKVECVFIPMKGRNTLCISSQVGCKMACSFCATGFQRFTRNLSSWEMLDQFLCPKFPEPVTNLVVMGMGEPFDNYDEVIRALEIFQDPMGFQIGKRHITVSTVGITSRIQQFLDADVGKLAISLHGTTEEQRLKVMPISKKYPLKGLIEQCRNARIKGRFRITFEYLLIKDFNDSREDALRLSRLLAGIPCKINLLAYNENPFIRFKRPTEERILEFQKILMGKFFTVNYRFSRGRDIAGACGQLSTYNKLLSKGKKTTAKEGRGKDLDLL